MKKNVSRIGAVVAACVWLLVGGGCATLGYYSQAVAGQMRLLGAREPVSRLLADPETDPGLKSRLQLTAQILDYAEQTMGLPAGERYRSYVALQRSHVVYNLVAAPAYSVTPKTWCHPFVGCVPYRGYFQRERAQAAAVRLAAQGFDTTVAGVPAYSTLGWFDDPLLSTFIDWPEHQLAALLIHELSHSRIWVPSDVGFNEAFASFVGDQGARDWAAVSGLRTAGAGKPPSRRAWARLRDLLLAARARLQEGFAAVADDAERAALKAAVYGGVQECYVRHRARLGAGRFDDYIARLNNAALASLSTYYRWEPGFARLFARAAGSWPEFFGAVEALAAQPPDRREAEITRLADEEVAQRRDDDDTDEIQCQAFARHDLEGKAAGTEHDDVRGGGNG